MNTPILSLSNVSKRFGSVVASQGVTFDLYPNEIHALIGPNGAGKSTLIQQIGGLLASDEGTITLDGGNITALDSAARASRGLARSFQVSSIAPDFTALQNVMLAVAGKSGSVFRFFKPALKDKSLVEPALESLTRVGMGDRAEVLASELSHGEKRMLEIAIALALKPRAFLLDEPMAGMGTEGSARLTALLATLKSEAPILLVEHDMDAVFALADRITVLLYGKVIANGSVEEIRADAQVREAYLGEEP